MEKNEDHSVTYGTDQENEVKKIFIIISTVCLTVSGMISIHIKWLQISDARQK